MKRILSILFAAFLALQMLVLPVNVSAESSGGSDIKGTRSVTFISDISNMNNYIDGGRAAFDLSLRKNAPEWLDYSLKADGRNVVTSVSFDFVSYGELSERLGVLVCGSPSVIYSNDDGETYVEGFSSEELLNFALLPISGGATSVVDIFKLSDNSVSLNGNVHGSSGNTMSVFNGDKITVDSIEIVTDTNDGQFKRTVRAKVNNSKSDSRDVKTVQKHFKTVGKPTVEELGNTVSISVEFDANTQSDLTKKTMMCLCTPVFISETYKFIDENTVNVTKTEYIDFESIMREGSKDFKYDAKFPESYRDFEAKEQDTVTVSGNSVSARNESKITFSYDADPGFTSVDIINDYSSLIGKLKQTVVFKMPSSVAEYYHTEIKDELAKKLEKGCVLDIYDENGYRCYAMSFSSMFLGDINSFSSECVGITCDLKKDESFIPLLNSHTSARIKLKSPVKRFADPNEADVTFILPATSFSPDSNAKEGMYVSKRNVTFSVGQKGSVEFNYRNIYLPKTVLFLIAVSAVAVAVIIIVKKIRKYKKKDKSADNAADFVCPECKQNCNENDMFCPNCGFKLK